MGRTRRYRIEINPSRPVCRFHHCPLWGRPVVGWEEHPDPVAVLVGEAPGKDEEESGYPFVGKSGRELNMYLEQFTRISRDRFDIGNLVRCRPPKNRDPHRTEIDICSTYLQVDLDELQPRIVGAIGRLSASWLMGYPVKMEKSHGVVYEIDNRIIVPVYHPASGLHSPRRMREIINDFTVLGEVIRGERGITTLSGIAPNYTFSGTEGDVA